MIPPVVFFIVFFLFLKILFFFFIADLRERSLVALSTEYYIKSVWTFCVVLTPVNYCAILIDLINYLQFVKI